MDLPTRKSRLRTHPQTPWSARPNQKMRMYAPAPAGGRAGNKSTSRMWPTSLRIMRKPVHTEPEAAGRRQPVHQGGEVVLVDDHGVLVARNAAAAWATNMRRCSSGSHQLAERASQFTTHVQLVPATPPPSPASSRVRPGQAAIPPAGGRHHEDGVPDVRLDRLLVDLEDDLPHAGVRLDFDADLHGGPPKAARRRPSRAQTLDTRVLLDQVDLVVSPPRTAGGSRVAAPGRSASTSSPSNSSAAPASMRPRRAASCRRSRRRPEYASSIVNSGLWRGERPSFRNVRHDLVDPLEPTTDDQPLQVKLCGDAKMEVQASQRCSA